MFSISVGEDIAGVSKAVVSHGSVYKPLTGMIFLLKLVTALAIRLQTSVILSVLWCLLFERFVCLSAYRKGLTLISEVETDEISGTV